MRMSALTELWVNGDAEGGEGGCQGYAEHIARGRLPRANEEVESGSKSYTMEGGSDLAVQSLAPLDEDPE
jgi:hypothetical protein